MKPLRTLFLAVVLPVGLSLAAIALLVHFQRLPSDFWSLTLKNKWTTLKSFLSDPLANPAEKRASKVAAAATVDPTPTTRS